MILYNHENYEHYKAVQKKLTARKTMSGKSYFSWCDEEMMKITDYFLHQHLDDIRTILCHGVRCGTEVDMLQRLNPMAKVYGTDLYGDAYRFDKTYFREIDFDIVPLEWVGYFDVIYSNSIDHSRQPINTLLAWKSELRNGGICYVIFYWETGVSKEDCFHLDGIDYKKEIEEIAEKVQMNMEYISLPNVDKFGNHYADVIMRKE